MQGHGGGDYFNLGTQSSQTNENTTIESLTGTQLMEKYQQLSYELRVYPRSLDDTHKLEWEQHDVRKELARRVEDSTAQLKAVLRMQEHECRHKAGKDNWWSDMLPYVRDNAEKAEDLYAAAIDLARKVDRTRT